jgi:glycosyltransferase involved in cell wall biosynthesis
MRRFPGGTVYAASEQTVLNPFISVIIPTFNRARSLRDTVNSFRAQTYPGNRFEIIIVDNASSDETPSMIPELARRAPRMRFLVEQRRGAHFARNSGAKAARGEILYFTDDDMIADPNMLLAIVTAFKSNANVASATGKVVPLWETEPPAWILAHCKNEILSLNDRGDGLIISDRDPGVFSCHQAVLRDAFFAAGGFNPDTNADTFVGDNETGLNIKIAKLGYRFAYVGSSITRHRIPATRMTQSYLNQRFADQGFCDSYTTYRDRVPGRVGLLSDAAAQLSRAIPASLLAVARSIRGDSRWRLNVARLFYIRNRITYDLRLARSAEWRRFAIRSDWIAEPAE